MTDKKSLEETRLYMEQLERELSDVKSRADRLEKIREIEERTKVARRWIIRTPNKNYTGVSAGVPFVSGLAVLEPDVDQRTLTELRNLNYDVRLDFLTVLGDEHDN